MILSLFLLSCLLLLGVLMENDPLFAAEDEEPGKECVRLLG